VSRTESTILVVGDMRTSSARNLAKGRAVMAYAHALQAANTPGVDATLAAAEAILAVIDAQVEWPGDADLQEMYDVLDQL